MAHLVFLLPLGIPEVDARQPSRSANDDLLV